jgi:regulator of protease activity HflC (stomatin/prohibitin superfamily)
MGVVMNVDLDDESRGWRSLPRFQRATVHAQSLWTLAVIVGAAALSLCIAALAAGLLAPESIWVPLFCNNAASLIILMSAARSAQALANWRRDANRFFRFDQRGGEESAVSGQQSGPEATAESTAETVNLEPLELGGVSLIALLAIRYGWNLALPATDPGTVGSVVGGLLLTAAFGLLVLERHFANSTSAEWPEASRLTQLTRVPIVTLSLSALGLFASRTGSVWPVKLMVLIGVLPAMVALELLLRAVLAVFRPQRTRQELRLVADSFLAELLRWPPRPLFSTLQEELRSRTGIDLRQIWAFSFIRRAILPILAGVVLVGWLLSGIREIPMGGRGIYERFGKPEAVLSSGLHIGMPWPFGQMVLVENGIVHELAATLPGNDAAEAPAPAEGPAPASANRLWDVAHALEKSQIIASEANNSQSFQIVDLDVRFFYRIGLSDEAALAATYNNTDLPDLIRSTAGRVLVHEFASRTLDGVLGERRTALAQEISTALQAELDRIRSGVEILAVVIEATHPPAGAANAYHGVQAAEIGVQALVARERGNAAEQSNEAEMNATIMHDRAAAAASENNAIAEAASIRAGAEKKAYEKSGRVFLLERYFEQLNEGLSQSRLLILDHRIMGNSAPTIDLRDFALPIAPALPEEGAPKNAAGKTEGQP